MKALIPAALSLCVQLTLLLPVQARPVELNTPEARSLAGVIDQVLLAHADKDLNRLSSFFHPQVRALWSNGRLMTSRAELQQTYADSFLKYRKFTGSWTPDYMDIEGETAWMTGEMSWSAIALETQLPIELSVRSTYILRRVEGRWLIMLEHSSHRSSD